MESKVMKVNPITYDKIKKQAIIENKTIKRFVEEMFNAYKKDYVRKLREMKRK